MLQEGLALGYTKQGKVHDANDGSTYHRKNTTRANLLRQLAP
jgi:hypothetical protein